MLMGAFDSGQTTTLAQVAEQRGIPLVVSIAAAPPITEQGYKFIVRNFPRAPEIVSGAFDVQKQLFAATGKTPTKAVVLNANDTYGMTIKAALGPVAEAMKMPYQIVDSITYDVQARDLSVEVAKAKATGAELVLAVSRLQDAILLTREMVKQRFEPWGIVSVGPGYYEGAYMSTLGRLGDFPISTVPWFDPTKPLAQKMRDAHLKMFPGQVVDTNTVYSFEGMLICADAYKRAGTTAPQALAQAMRATNIKANASLSDGISFDEKGQNNGLKIAGIQNVGGTTKLVIPVASSEQKPTFPMPSWQSRG
jgi:branched-chain amino acid transport system substrate-binding protein